jgi:hypothetical protein
LFFAWSNQIESANSQLEDAIKALVAGDAATFQAIVSSGEDDDDKDDGDNDADEEDEGDHMTHDEYVERMTKAEALLSTLAESADEPSASAMLKKLELVTILRRKLTANSDSGTSYHVALTGM